MKLGSDRKVLNPRRSITLLKLSQQLSETPACTFQEALFPLKTSVRLDPSVIFPNATSAIERRRRCVRNEGLADLQISTWTKPFRRRRHDWNTENPWSGTEREVGQVRCSLGTGKARQRQGIHRRACWASPTLCRDRRAPRRQRCPFCCLLSPRIGERVLGIGSCQTCQGSLGTLCVRLKKQPVQEGTQLNYLLLYGRY